MMLSRTAAARAPRTAARPMARRAPLVAMAARPVFVNAASAETLDKVRGIISEQLGTDLDTVEIMMALEEQFDITLDEEGAENISTVQEAADLIEAQVEIMMALEEQFD